MEPRIAACMTGIRLPCTAAPLSSLVLCFLIRIKNRIISTIDPSAVSTRIPATFGIFLASSCPAKPNRFAGATMPI